MDNEIKTHLDNFYNYCNINNNNSFTFIIKNSAKIPNDNYVNDVCILSVYNPVECVIYYILKNGNFNCYDCIKQNYGNNFIYTRNCTMERKIYSYINDLSYILCTSNEDLYYVKSDKLEIKIRSDILKIYQIEHEIFDINQIFEVKYEFLNIRLRVINPTFESKLNDIKKFRDLFDILKLAKNNKSLKDNFLKILGY